MCWQCSIPFISLHRAHLENSVKIRFLLVSADFVQGQKGEDPARLLPCAPLLQQLLHKPKIKKITCVPDDSAYVETCHLIQLRVLPSPGDDTVSGDRGNKARAGWRVAGQH